MATDDYRRALEAAIQEYERLAAQRAEIDKRLAQLGQTMGGLMRLCELTPTVSWGLTDACRMVLKGVGQPLTVPEIRAQLEAMGFDLSRYSNDLATVHTVLKRLTRSGEVRVTPRAFDKPVYQWVQPAQVIGLSASAAQALFGPGPAAPSPERRRRAGK